MLTQLLRQARLAALALAVLALPVLAAPVLKPTTVLRIDKYLLDDCESVLVVNIKQIAESPAYKKGFAKQLADLVARPEAQEYLKDIGFDPLKDIEEMIVCTSKSCWRSDNSKDDREDGPFVLFRGKFDTAKLKAKMEALVKDHSDKVASVDAPGGHKIYRIDPRNGPYAALLDSRTIVIAGKKAHVLDALAKAGGKKTTTLIYKEAAAQVKKFKPEVTVQGFALESFVMESHHTSIVDGAGKRTFKKTEVTLADKGFASATLSITIKDDARGSIVWNVKDREKAKKMNEVFTTGLEEARKMGRQQAAKDPRFAPLVRFLEGVTIKSAGQTMTMEAKAEVDMVESLLTGWFRVVGQ